MFTKIMKLLTALCLSILAVASVSQAQSCTPAPIGLISWWMADGNALDARSRNNGTLQGGATFGSGEAGQAFSFDGINDQIVIADSDDLSPQMASANGEITVSAWINLTAMPTVSGATVFMKGSGDAVTGQFEYELAIAPTGE